MDPFELHMENLTGCNDDGFDANELEPEATGMDRMHLALQSAWEALQHTNAGEVKG